MIGGTGDSPVPRGMDRRRPIVEAPAASGCPYKQRIEDGVEK
jgi:hypothetical protein